MSFKHYRRGNIYRKTLEIFYRLGLIAAYEDICFIVAEIDRENGDIL